METSRVDGVRPPQRRGTRTFTLSRAGVVKMFKQIHQDVEKKSKEFYDVLRRYNYVTPTSYLELLSSFDTLLSYKRGEVKTKKDRLKIGLDKIISTGELVEGMQKVRDAALKLKLNLTWS